VADAVLGAFNANTSIPIAFGSLDAARLTQVSGEIATGAQQATFNAMDLFMGVMADPFVPGRREDAGAGGPLGYAGTGRSVAAIPTPAILEPPAVRWNVWSAAYGGTRRTGGNSVLGSNDAITGVGGMAVGADYRAAPNTLAGFALGGAGTSFGVANGGSGRSDMFQAGSFVRQEAGTAYFLGALAYGWQDVTTDRALQIAGADQLRGQGRRLVDAPRSRLPHPYSFRRRHALLSRTVGDRLAARLRRAGPVRRIDVLARLRHESCGRLHP